MKEHDVGPLSESERLAEMQMHAARQQAAAQQAPTYSCPTHGILLPANSPCPLCRSQAQYEAENETKFLHKTAGKMREHAKSWALSAITLGGALPVGNYNHYYNQVACPHHGISHERGTTCPMCLQASVRSGEIARHEAEEYARRQKELVEQIKKLTEPHFVPSAERGEQVAHLQHQLQALAIEHRFRASYELPFKATYDYVQYQMKAMAERDKKYRFNLKYE
jgi:hypothetical protein